MLLVWSQGGTPAHQTLRGLARRGFKHMNCANLQARISNSCTIDRIDRKSWRDELFSSASRWQHASNEETKRGIAIQITAQLKA
jgi:hypothetical protein